MKKIIVVLFFIMVLLLLTNNETNTVVIPSDAIRFRIIANSNSFADQEQKIAIKEELKPVFTDILKKTNSKEETQELIKSDLKSFEKVIDKHNIPYNINYGLNHFPKKVYKGVTYPEGEYESLVITLGDGLGDNWWCVLFPPLCLLEAEEENIDSYTYSFYLKDIIDKYT